MRDETEWVELVEIGANSIVGADPALIANQLNTSEYKAYTSGLYGDGFSGLKITRIIK
jgi:UDP-GlcNAc3NAcA epimerase